MARRIPNYRDFEPKEEKFTPEQIESAKNLYDIICRPLETKNQEDCLGRSYDLSVSPSNDCAFFMPNGIRETFESAVNATVRMGADWRVYFQYDPRQDRLAVDTIGIPTISEKIADKGTSGTTILKRLGTYGFYVFTQDEDGVIRQHMNDSEEAETLLNGSSITTRFDDEALQTMLDEINVASRFNGSFDSSEATARTLSTIPKWRGKDRILTPIELDRQISIVRVDDLDTVTADKPQFDTTHEATLETVLEDGNRQQLIIRFKAEDFTVKPPEIFVQEIKKTSDIKDTLFFGSGAYKVKGRLSVEPTTEIMDMLAEQLLEELADVA